MLPRVVKLRASMDVIETDRLRLEPLDESRVEEFVSLTADPEVMRWWAPGGAFTREEANPADTRRPGGSGSIAGYACWMTYVGLACRGCAQQPPELQRCPLARPALSQHLTLRSRYRHCMRADPRAGTGEVSVATQGTFPNAGPIKKPCQPARRATTSRGAQGTFPTMAQAE